MVRPQPQDNDDEQWKSGELAEDERGAIEPLEPESRRARGPVYRRVYTTGNAELDRQVNEIVGALSFAAPGTNQPVEPADLELVREMLTSSLRLVTQHATRAEMKLVNAAVKEFAYSFRVFAPYRNQRKVSIFGSARVQPGEQSYAATREFAAEIAKHGWMVITGAGPGIMAAGHEGAGVEQSFGANIRLPGLNPANAYIAKDGKLVNFKYFFTRKVTFLKESDAFVLLPGGFGTLDEAFELLTLMQTGKTPIRPVVLLEPAGSDYWRQWLRFVGDQIVAPGLASPEDLSLFERAGSIDGAVTAIERFYSNYQSARYVGERLVIRLRKAPSPEALRRLNRDFADIVARGRIEVISITPAEARDDDAVGLDRIAFFPEHNFGRIRQLIDMLNEV